MGTLLGPRYPTIYLHGPCVAGICRIVELRVSATYPFIRGYVARGHGRGFSCLGFQGPVAPARTVLDELQRPS